MTPPTPSADSYGTVAGVAALARTWTTNNTFEDQTIYVDGTNPELTSVVEWIDQISGTLNLALAKYGFKVPLVTANGRLAAKSIVEQITADLVKYVNNQGRFFSQRFVDGGGSVWKAIRSDLDLWVSEFGPGLSESGEVQTTTNIDEVGYRQFDEAGEETFPIFQRKGFGNRFDDWTKS